MADDGTLRCLWWCKGYEATESGTEVVWSQIKPFDGSVMELFAVGVMF